MSTQMANALKKCDTLEELHISTTDAVKWLSADAEPSLPLATILQAPELQIIRCRGLAQKDAVFNHLNSIPSIPHILPLFMFEPLWGEADDTGRYIWSPLSQDMALTVALARPVPDLLEVAAQELVADLPLPLPGPSYNMDPSGNWQTMVSRP